MPKAEIEGDGRSADGLRRAHVAGAQEADRRGLEIQDLPDLHQPAAREDRRHVQQPRNHHRQPRAEVLCLVAWTSAASPASRTATSWSAAGPGQGGQEKVAPPSARSQFDIIRRGHLEERRPARPRGRKRIVERAAPGSRTANSSARVARTRKQFSGQPEVYKAIDDRVRRELGLTREAEPGRRRLPLVLADGWG